MEAAKRPAENEANGDTANGGKKAKLDPECGALLFCGTTEWHNVRYGNKILYFTLQTGFLFILFHIQSIAGLKVQINIMFCY